MGMTPRELADELERLSIDSAIESEPPWVKSKRLEHGYSFVIHDDGATRVAGTEEEGDADLIVCMRNHLPTILAALRFQSEVDEGVEELRANPPDPFDPDIENDPSWDRGFELGWQTGNARGQRELTDANRLKVIAEIRAVDTGNPSGWAAIGEYERRVKERMGT